MTFKQACTVTIGTILHHVQFKNANGSPLRAKVNGKCKTWKTRKGDFKLPIKHGLYDCSYITPSNAHEWILPKEF